MSVLTRSVGGRGYISDEESSDDSLHPIHGTAIGSNDITRGHLSGERKLWTPEVLSEAAETLIGKEIVLDHNNRSSREVIGEVTNARFEEGQGVIYKGVVSDDEIADKIGYGWLDVSPRILHSEEAEERGDLKVPKKIHAFDNLSVVPRGASPSNEVSLGDPEELMSVEELQEAFDDVDGVVDEFQEVEENQDLNVDFKEHLYDDAEAAQGASESLGCSGYHTHEVEGDTWYMPCSTHGDFLKQYSESGGGETEENSEPENEEEDSEVEELSQDSKKRIASQMSSHSNMTKDEAQSLLNAIDPNEPEGVGALALTASKSLGVNREEAEKALESLSYKDKEKDEYSEESNTRDDSPSVRRSDSLNRLVG